MRLLKKSAPTDTIYTIEISEKDIKSLLNYCKAIKHLDQSKTRQDELGYFIDTLDGMLIAELI